VGSYQKLQNIGGQFEHLRFQMGANPRRSSPPVKRKPLLSVRYSALIF
jgi:hypothetical protein